MQVYGDRARRVSPRQRLRELTASLRATESASPGRERHDLLMRAFLQAAGLAQGLADAAFEAAGSDGPDPAQDAAMALLGALARKLATSAWSDFAAIGPPSSAELMSLALAPLPDEIEVRTPEGYAFYALYPEAYLKAAAERPWSAPPLVVGVRSIGAGLAALVAAVTSASQTVTVRPVGHPFRRELRLSAELERRLAAHEGPFAVADEGPGLSGSSFAAVAEALARLGVEPDRIVYLPSHEGEPGPQATPERRARWRRTERRPATLDALIAEEPLAAWFEDVTGPIGRIEDLSGGRWADERPDAPAIQPALERRKFRLASETGLWLAKFAGLGEIGEAKLARARTLARAGVSPEPLALRHGFLIERWVPGAPGPQVERAAMVEHLGRYQAYRALAFPAEPEDGAGLAELAAMARTNVAELLGEAAADALPQPPRDSPTSPIHVDGRLHRWEWLTTPDGRLIKTDALDHSAAHDLVGCQDVAWDIAGAQVELDLAPAETRRLCDLVAEIRGQPVDEALLAFHLAAYPAFQAGLWSLSSAEREIARYAARLG
jgi:hypothetical protein